MEIDFLKELNEPQRKAVEYIDGPSLVIAGAGSGKTRVLTYKIAYLLKLGIKPWNLLSLTFTNKAAREMKERISSLVGSRESQSLWMGTFHSIFSRILRQEASFIGFTPTFTIYQPNDCKSLVKTIVKEFNLDEKIYKPATIYARISEAKNHLLLPSDYNSDFEINSRNQNDGLSALGQIYQQYVSRLHQANVMDFDDLLVNTYLLFNQYPDIRRKYSERFSYILVDEYQDTNYVQYKILQLLSEENQRICVVGDDAQSIYSFRGARIDNILQFTKQYKNAKLFKLEQNYRSTQTIVQAANSLIAHNTRQIPKNVFSENESGSPIPLNVAYTDVEEGEIVCNRIRNLHLQEDMSYQNIAILYRTNAQSRIFEEGLRKRSIPYRVYGGQSFYDHKEIRDILAYFRLVVNCNDEEALKRIINYPTRGIGNTTLQKLSKLASENETSIWQILNHADEYQLSVSSAALNKLIAFREKIKSFISDLHTQDAYQLGTRIIKESGIEAEAHKSTNIECVEMQQLLSEFINALYSFVEAQRESGEEDSIFLPDYLNVVSLLSDQDQDETEEQNKVTLMTVHAAKGLEFDAVFIVGLEQNLFPNALCMGSFRALEEERRLFYVAITRAKNYCFLSCSKTRFKYGKMEYCSPSSFLKDIDSQYLRLNINTQKTECVAQRTSCVPTQRPGFGVSRLKPIVSNKEVVTEGEEYDTVEINGQKFSKNQKVLHERFGCGVILKLEGESGNYKAAISFENSGQKNILLKYAKIKVIPS